MNNVYHNISRRRRQKNVRIRVSNVSGSTKINYDKIFKLEKTTTDEYYFFMTTLKKKKPARACKRQNKQTAF